MANGALNLEANTITHIGRPSGPSTVVHSASVCRLSEGVWCNLCHDTFAPMPPAVDEAFVAQLQPKIREFLTHGHGSTIRTEYVYPPIPPRSFDWAAYYDGREEDGPYGFGETQEAAIQALLDEAEDEAEDEDEHDEPEPGRGTRAWKDAYDKFHQDDEREDS